jgi:VWFA-related protein
MLSYRPSRTRLLFSLFAALCLLAPVGAFAQQTPAPQPTPPDEEEVVRVSSDLVQTDVMVFDSGGKFVEGLKPEQFELKVDGKPQEIVFFDRVEAGTVNEDAQLAAARGLKSATDKGASVPLDRGRTVVFFVDDLHLSAASSMRIKKTLQRFINEEIGQNDEALVASASGQIGFLSQFTEDKIVLRAAAERINARPNSTRDMDYPPMTEAHAQAIERNDTTVFEFFVRALLQREPNLTRQAAEVQVQLRARLIAVQSNSISQNTLASLYSMVRNSSQIPGRKIVFFISDGFLVDDRDGNLREWMRRIADAAARAGVVIYSLDAEGLRTGQPDASSDVAFDPAGQLAQVNMGETSALQSPLYTLASETGGRALLNTNALNRAVSGVLKETARYYLLAWKPDVSGEHGGLKYQRVEVSVRSRPDLRVIVRRGFYNAKPPVEKPRESGKKKKSEDATEVQPKTTAERELFSALRAPLPRVSLSTSLALNYLSTKNGALLTASVEVDHEGVVFEQGEKPHALFDIIGVILNDHGKPANGFQQQLSVTLDTSRPMSQQRILYTYQLRVPPGLYQARVAVRDARSGRTGSAMQWVEIPDFKPGQISLSSIFIGERQSSEHPDQLKPEELAKGVLLSVHRRFARTSWIRFMTFIYNATAAGTAQPDVALQVQLFRDDQPVFTAPLSRVTTEGLPDPTRIPYAAELALASFPAGRYVLQVTAIDRAAKTSVSQRASFVIE